MSKHLRGFCVPRDVDQVEMVLKVPKSALMTSHSLMVYHQDTDSVRAITPGLPLFLYNYDQLHGIFEV
ncbi:hypothetical protein CTI12_AA015890 [Artemisia annua]|uniref:DCD domain-containing protein n=1 Tax=Artemisia annua TaxID=35608 RepID=A0A2U1Q458_ARTAN|nr:hypothetical protein CTI12_AA015890 [Artemisia annua]